MNNTQMIQSGGVQTTVILPQIIYLDFDGELTRYNGELLTIDDVTVEDSGLTEERIAQITQALNDRFAGQNVLFVSDRSDKSGQSDYSTIFVGKTSSFAPYGTFAGLAETVDSGNMLKNDNAFVMLDSLSSNDRIADVIAHEAGHLLGTLDHGGEGLARYAARYDVSSGVTSTGIVLSSWDFMCVCSGGTANSTTVNSRGCLYVSSGGTANRTTVNGGSMYVSSGGTANSTTVSSGGSLYVSSGGTANSTTVNSRGCLYVSSGGTANSTTVNSGGSLYVSSGGTANSTTVNSGSLYVSSGGTANNTTVNSKGKFIVSKGGTCKGRLQIANGAYVSAYQGAIIDFTVAEQTGPAKALINNWSLISGGNNASYTITVNAAQACGTYMLAKGAADFTKVVTVKTADNTMLGTLTLGETKAFDNKGYTLVLDSDNVLKLTIGDAGTISAKSDVDGNGISDVMFQYTGGDYQIGFWMNGMSTWLGTGVSQPDNWVLLGNSDMDTNGKADQVMFGNVLGGAYIGYYKDGDTTTNGWVTIGYLDNPGNIEWKNVIGNLTGNEGKNSIVWQSPELGALGVWTDGTANWVSLGSGYDSNWTMLGCGDFDGNGKDEVLFSHNGNLYTTDIDQNFTSLGGWGTDWEVKTIGDFAGDGQDDIILQNGNMIVKFNNGKADEWESIGVMDASDWFIVGAGDYNNDQQDDLLVRQYSTGMLGYYSAGDMSQWNELGRGVDMNWSVIA